MRNSARQNLVRAKVLLALSDEHSLRYACLELRFCIEHLALDLFQGYLDELPNDVMWKWTPKQIISDLLDADPTADKTATIAVGLETVPGVPSTDMHTLGEDRRFSLQWANKNYNALGNFLHAPSLQQLKDKQLASLAAMRHRAGEIVVQLDHILKSPVWNVIGAPMYEVDCSYCKSRIKRRVRNVTKAEGLVCNNTKCRAVYDVVNDTNPIQFRPRQVPFECTSCKVPGYLGVHMMNHGNVILCVACDGKSEIKQHFSFSPFIEDDPADKCANSTSVDRCPT